MALSGLVPAQLAVGLDVSVVSTFSEGADSAVADSLRAAGADVRLVGPCRQPLSRHEQLAEIVSDAVKTADIVHIHGLWEEIQHQAARAAQRLGRPYIIRPCGMLDPWSLAQGRWKKRLYMLLRLRRNLNEAAALHFTAEAERDLTRPLGLRAPAIVEPNGIDLAEFETLPPKGTFRKRYGIPQDAMLVLFLSRLHPKKGLELLIPAFTQAVAGLGPAGAQSWLVIAGPDSERYQAKLEMLVARRGLPDRTLFVGMQKGPERVAALADADLFVLPSHQENFGIVIVEALAAGTPVITTDQVNIHAEISSAGAGIIVPVEVRPLAEALVRWIENASLRQEAGERARSYATRVFDWNGIARRWVGHYSSLSKKRMPTNQERSQR